MSIFNLKSVKISIISTVFISHFNIKSEELHLCQAMLEYDASYNIPNYSNRNSNFFNIDNSYNTLSSLVYFIDNTLFLKNKTGELVELDTSQSEKWLFVEDLNHQVYTHPAQKRDPLNRFSHSSFGFEEVIAAGAWSVKNGKIIRISSDSGHYGVCWTINNPGSFLRDGSSSTLGLKHFIDGLCYYKVVPASGIIVHEKTFWSSKSSIFGDPEVKSHDRIYTLNSCR